MTETVRRRRKRSKAFAAPQSGQTREARTGWRRMSMLAIAPTVLFAGHLVFGAYLTVPSLIFTAILAAGMCAALIVPGLRQGLFDIRPTWAPGGLFLLVIAVAAWTLTPWTPGGPHPIWEWAEIGPGASTVNRGATLIEIAKLMGLACAFIIGVLHGAWADRAKATIDVLMIVGAVYAAISLLTLLTGLQVLDTSRLSGGFLSPNCAGTVFGMLSVVALAGLLRRWRQTAGLGPFIRLGQVAAPLAYLLLFLCCLLMTASRMGLAATAVAAAALLAWELWDASGQRLPIMIGAAVASVFGVILALSGNTGLWGRVDTLGSDVVERGRIFSAHWDAFLASPLFGYGLGSFNDVNYMIMNAENYSALHVIRSTHNVYLQWLEEAGLVGSAPMFLLIAVIIGVAVWRTTALRSGKTVARGLIAANLVVLIHGLSDFALQTPSIAAFWAFLLGLQFAFGQSRT